MLGGAQRRSLATGPLRGPFARTVAPSHGPGESLVGLEGEEHVGVEGRKWRVFERLGSRICSKPALLQTDGVPRHTQFPRHGGARPVFGDHAQQDSGHQNSLTAVSRLRAMESRSATTGLRSTQPVARAPARWQGRGAARGRWVHWRQRGSLRRCHPWGRPTGQGAARHLRRDFGARPRDPGGVLAFPPWPAPAWVKAEPQRWISSDV